MKFRGISVLLLAIVMLAAACGTSGAPEEYNQTTADNYIDGCMVALDEDPRASDANAVCTCAYDAISEEDSADYIPFEDFKELDDELRNDVNAIGDTETGREVTVVVADCIRSLSTS